MNQKKYIAGAVLWAAAIIASAAAGAPQFLSLVLLPALAAVALLIDRPGTLRHCRGKAPAR